MMPTIPLACTTFTQGTLPRAAALAESFCRQHPGARFVLVGLDPNARPVRYRGPGDLITAEGLGVPGLYEACLQFAPDALPKALLPRVLERLAAEDRPAVLLYLDPDQLVFEPLSEALRLADEAEIVLHSEGDEPETDLLALRRGEAASEFLAGWDGSLAAAAQGFQPAVLADPSYGVDPANAAHRKLRYRDGRFLVRRRPMVTFRHPGARANRQGLNTEDRAALRAVSRTFEEAVNRTAAAHPPAARPQAPLHPILRDLYLGLPQEDRERFGNPFRPVGAGLLLRWALRPTSEGGLSPFLAGVHACRADLKTTFKDPAGRDRNAFLNWAATYGASELGFDRSWVGGEREAAVIDSTPSSAAILAPEPPAELVAGSQVSYAVGITNPGPGLWPALGPNPTRLAIRFEGAEGGGECGLLTAIGPGQTVTLCVSIQVPVTSGEWNLVHELHLPGGLLQHSQAVAIRPTDALAACGVNVVGSIKSEKGLGEAARSLVRAAMAVGIPTAVNDYTDCGAENIDTTLRGLRGDNPYPVNLLSVNPDTLPHFLWAAGTKYLRGRYNIGYWFWELPEFPPEWRDRFAFVNEVWVGSRFTMEAVAAASPVPVVRVPCVVDVADPGPICGRARFGIPERAFTFLFMFDLASSIERKNPLGLIDAFYRAFPDRKNVRLVVKCSRGGKHPGLDRIRVAVRDSRVIVIDEVLARPEACRLMALADCYVSLHRSEGFGLTMAEAMALGKPVIGTGWSGNTDFMTPSNSLLVNCKLGSIDKNDGPYRRGGTWAEPDLDHAAELMRVAYFDRDRCDLLAAQAKEDMAANYSPRVVGGIIRERLRTLARQGTLTIPAAFFEAPAACLRNEPETAASPVAVFPARLETPCAPTREPAPMDYNLLRLKLRDAVETNVPERSVILVACKGDPELVRFAGREGRHFPRTYDGLYAGFHPAGDAEALDHLAAQRRGGATHFLLPATMAWWQTHYPGFRAELRRGRVIIDQPGIGLLIELATDKVPAPAPIPARCRVVIPVHNHSKLTRQCLEAVLRTLPAGVEIRVTDDGSTDDTPQVLDSFRQKLGSLRHERPAGFAAACNAGAAGAHGEYLVFLNNDTIPELGWLDALLHCASAHPGAGIIGAKLLYPNRTIQHAGMAIGQNGHPCHLYVGFPADHPAVNLPREVPMVTGACLLVRRELFERLGGFDTHFHNGYEDVDLCLRARDAGFAVRYCPESVVLHLESMTRGSNPARDDQDLKNWDAFRQRWAGKLTPNDLPFYLQDGLLRLTYKDQGYVTLSVSPLLGQVVYDPA